ncbi:MAG: hypothetical protein IKY33_04030 [Clostridia bacterium]|nr:hypothetical protein [Clostridia bacterium]
MAKLYADFYGLLKTAGTDYHGSDKAKLFTAILTQEKIKDEAHFVRLAKALMRAGVHYLPEGYERPASKIIASLKK